MRSPLSLDEDDLHTAARIRAAAVRVFGASGFGVGLRAIAADAGVSAASIVKHFGSKAGLREACDEFVLRVIREGKRETVGTGDVTAILRELAASERYEDVARYVVASLSEGGSLARTLFEHMVADAVEYLEAGVAAGVIRPSRDPAARARFLTQAGVGALLVEIRLTPPEELDMVDLVRHLERTTMLPALELYTEGLFTDSRILDALLAETPVPHDVAPDPPAAAG
ncbi:TetR/AcrR family transcriptional regulator [Georgenia sp. EYE_87]|uniref:TetR/AcrR family transcriptional regulator n=1 Tax=Georgenia sp. EYE_87 TaxID=2853448 RepID=UPI0020065310|nr:TetR family transcriptional regulator [Georgenia sp. EYE_87]